MDLGEKTRAILFLLLAVLSGALASLGSMVFLALIALGHFLPVVLPPRAGRWWAS
jgi:hypothetical protein